MGTKQQQKESLKTFTIQEEKTLQTTKSKLAQRQTESAGNIFPIGQPTSIIPTQGQGEKEIPIQSNPPPQIPARPPPPPGIFLPEGKNPTTDDIFKRKKVKTREFIGAASATDITVFYKRQDITYGSEKVAKLSREDVLRTKHNYSKNEKKLGNEFTIKKNNPLGNKSISNPLGKVSKKTSGKKSIW